MINEVHVKEGNIVKAGQELLVTSSDPELEGGASLADELRLSMALQNKAQQGQMLGKLGITA